MRICSAWEKLPRWRTGKSAVKIFHLDRRGFEQNCGLRCSPAPWRSQNRHGMPELERRGQDQRQRRRTGLSVLHAPGSGESLQVKMGLERVAHGQSGVKVPGAVFGKIN